MKSTLEKGSSRLDDTEEQISELEDTIGIITQSEQEEEKGIKKKKSLMDLWENLKCTNICIIGNKSWKIGVPEGEGTENIFEEIMAELFPKLVKETNILIQWT